MGILLVNARLVNGTGPVVERAGVLIDGTRIAAAGPLAGPPAETEHSVIDLAGMTILPGLIDLHVHLWGDVSEYPQGRPHDRFGELVNNLEEHEAYLAMFMAANARRILEAGFTTIRDLGSPRDVAIQVARAECDGHIAAPRIVTCASIDITFPEGKKQNHGAIGGNVTGPLEAVRAVRQKIGSGADWIHLFATGSAAGFWGAEHQLLTLVEMQAAADEAHRLGRRVNANACGAPGIRDAIRAGVDSIEHGSYMSEADDLIELMQGHAVGWVPTLCVYEAQKVAAEVAAARGGEVGLPDYWIQRVLEEYEHLVQGYAKGRAAGLLIGLGTDSGAPHVAHGKNAQELEMFVRYGASETEAIRAATSNAAKILGLDHRIGNIEVGKEADLVVATENPLADIRVLQDERKIGLVFKAGVAVVNRLLPNAFGRR